MSDPLHLESLPLDIDRGPVPLVTRSRRQTPTKTTRARLPTSVHSWIAVSLHPCTREFSGHGGNVGSTTRTIVRPMVPMVRKLRMGFSLMTLIRSISDANRDIFKWRAISQRRHISCHTRDADFVRWDFMTLNHSCSLRTCMRCVWIAPLRVVWLYSSCLAHAQTPMMDDFDTM